MTEEEKKNAAKTAALNATPDNPMGALAGFMDIMPSGALQDIERAMKTAEIAIKLSQHEIQEAETREVLAKLAARLITFALRRSEGLETTN